ncbi:MAG: hypothetical protein IIT39_12035 [Clostridia bacterium]|nr:hypothetical protein [Clostridia bacterium]
MITSRLFLSRFEKMILDNLYSRNTANLRVFCVRGIIILISRLKRIQRHCRAVTSYSESVILSDMVGTSRHTATIRHPTPDERACVGIGIHSDRQGHPKEPCCIGTGTTRAAVSILFGYSVQTFTKYGKFESVLCERYNYTPKPFETHTAAL